MIFFGTAEDIVIVDHIFSDLTHLWRRIKQGHGRRRRKVTGMAETVSASEVGRELRNVVGGGGRQEQGTKSHSFFLELARLRRIQEAWQFQMLADGCTSGPFTYEVCTALGEEGAKKRRNFMYYINFVRMGGGNLDVICVNGMAP